MWKSFNQIKLFFFPVYMFTSHGRIFFFYRIAHIGMFCGRLNWFHVLRINSLYLTSCSPLATYIHIRVAFHIFVIRKKIVWVVMFQPNCIYTRYVLVLWRNTQKFQCQHLSWLFYARFRVISNLISEFGIVRYRPETKTIYILTIPNKYV